jgi:hypothetical protein
MLQYPPIPSYTWATKPVVAIDGQLARMSDVGTTSAGSLWMWSSDAGRWIPASGRVVLAISTSLPGVTGTIAETVLASYNLPAGIMGPNSQLIVTTFFDTSINTGTRTLRIKLGSTTFSTRSQANAGNPVNQNVCIIRNQTFTTIQRAHNGDTSFSGTITPIATGNENTANALTLAITGQCSSVAGRIGLWGYSVELIA